MVSEMSDLFPPSLDEQIQCVEREVRYRRHVYPRLIEKGRLTKAKAEREIEIMQSVLDKLKGQDR